MKVLEISKVFRVRCGHKLSKLPLDHKCRNPHGEYYSITLYFRTTNREAEKVLTTPPAMLVDFGDIKKDFKEIESQLDHHFLVWEQDEAIEVFEHLQKAGYAIKILPMPPTAEYLAFWVYNEMKKKPSGKYLYKVCVEESKDNYACYSEE